MLTSLDISGGQAIVIATIAALIVATIASAFWLAPRLAEGRVLFDRRPDPPAPFGYRMAWLAVRTHDMHTVADVLGLQMLQTANWRTGVGTIYDARLGENHIYISPPVNGWTFVIGLSLPQPLGAGFVDKCLPMMQDLAGRFPEAQYFLCCGSLDFYAWARVLDGKLVRAFAIGDEGVIWNKGKPSKEERTLGLKLLETKASRGRKGDSAAMLIYPTEAHVMHLASLWSLDPTSMATTAPADKSRAKTGAKGEPLGVVCATPANWRPERLRRTG